MLSSCNISGEKIVIPKEVVDLSGDEKSYLESIEVLIENFSVRTVSFDKKNDGDIEVKLSKKEQEYLRKYLKKQRDDLNEIYKELDVKVKMKETDEGLLMKVTLYDDFSGVDTFVYVRAFLLYLLTEDCLNGHEETKIKIDFKYELLDIYENQIYESESFKVSDELMETLMEEMNVYGRHEK